MDPQLLIRRADFTTGSATFIISIHKEEAGFASQKIHPPSEEEKFSES